MKGKYLITTDDWFIAPDGQQYKAAWGNVEIVNDTILGIKTNARSTNWFAKVGNDEKHIIIAGCQIHYAVKAEEKPNEYRAHDWTADAANGLKEYYTNCKIYFAE